jgi:hypothetical protein
VLNKYSSGVVLGLALSVLAVLTNVVFPNNGYDDGPMIGLIYLTLFILSIGILYFQSKKATSLKSGATIGAINFVIAFLITLFTYFAIDNLFLDTVSRQADKIWSFSHQNIYHNMRDFVNYGLLKGLLFGTIMAAIFGGIAGAIGVSLRKFRIVKYN